MSSTLRYARRLLIAIVVIAAIVGLGYLWRSSSLASVITDGGHDGRGPGGAGDVRDRLHERGGSAFSLDSIDDLLQTVLVGVLVLGAVVAIDKARRRRKPIRT